MSPLLPLAIAMAMLASGCGARPPMYAWGDLPRLQRETLAGGSPDLTARIQEMDAAATEAAAAGRPLPPGFRAHLGLLHLSNRQPALAGDSWRAEKAAFPESAPFMDAMLARLDSGTQAQP